MPTPTQVTGTVQESLASQGTTGFLGWSPDSSNARYTVIGGVDKGAYADNVAYSIGDSVTYNGERYVALQAVLNTNTTDPVVGAVWRLASDKRGPAETLTPTAASPQYYR
jgi:hypothetical protein